MKIIAKKLSINGLNFFSLPLTLVNGYNEMRKCGFSRNKHGVIWAKAVCLFAIIRWLKPTATNLSNDKFLYSLDSF